MGTTWLSPERKRRRAAAKRRQDARWRDLNGPVLRYPGTSPPDAQRNIPGDGPMSGTALSPVRETAAGYR